MSSERIAEGGSGGSATVFIELRNEFPGIGGTVRTEQDFVVAYREPKGVYGSHRNEDRRRRRRDGIRTYLRHTLAKKLDDFFFRRGDYRFPHIPRPLGSTKDGGYMYEWVNGKEGIYSVYYDPDLGQWLPVTIDEFVTAINCFSAVGIGLRDDITDADDGRSLKNLIFQEAGMPPAPTDVSKLWKRIDFGPESMRMDYELMATFIGAKREEMVDLLTEDRVRMMELSIPFLQRTGGGDPVPGDLANLVRLYRASTAEHMGVQEASTPPILRKKTNITPISPGEAAHRRTVSFSRRMSETPVATIDMEVRSAFPCADGTIYTHQEVPTAKITADGDQHSGLRRFLRMFILKKLENASIASGRYTYPHIPRPLGSEGQAFYREWASGMPRCPLAHLRSSKPSDKRQGLDDWHEFATSFSRAGIDMEKMAAGREAGETAGRILISQPHNLREPAYFSRLWKLAADGDADPFDLERLERYLLTDEDFLTQRLRPTRYETMLLAVQYLMGEDLGIGGRLYLKFGVRDYRLSALRHLDNYGFDYSGDVKALEIDYRVLEGIIADERIRGR